MIKKVQVEDLKIGVFVHDFNCGWKGGSLYIEPSVIKSESIVEILKSWGIKEVYIDTEKGLDVEKSKKASQGTEKDALELGIPRKIARPQVPLAQELEVAKSVTQDALKIIEETNRQILEGKPPEVGPAYELTDRMRNSINRNKDALLLLTRMRKKDEYTLYHSVSVCSLVLDMCNYFQISEPQSLNMAVGALFHDIGKAMIPHDILNKPSRLTDEEYRVMQRHAEYSVNLLSEAKGLPLECFDIALHHHERYDGNGYPDKLKHGQISFGSQLTCICDVFDAITSERCYKSGMDSVMGLRKIYEGSGVFFSKEMAHDFIQCIGVYPIGTCVVLADGRSGVVVGSTEDMMRPIVKVYFDEKKKQPITPLKIDLTKIEGEIASYSNPKKFGLNSSQLLKKFLIAES